MKKRRFWNHLTIERIAASAAIAGLFSPSPARAQPTNWTWTHNGSDNWSNSNNWVDNLGNPAVPTSSATTSLLFTGTSTSFTATNDLANFSLTHLAFGHTTGAITLAGGDLNFTNVLGNDPPSITVLGSGDVNITAGILNSANGSSGVNQPILLNLASSGNLTLAGSLGGNVSSGGDFYGLSSAGAGTGTLTLSGSGTTGFWSFGNRNTVVSGGNYTLASTFSDTGNRPKSSLVVGTAADQFSALSLTDGTQIKAVSVILGLAAGSNADVTITGTGTVLNAGVTTSGLNASSLAGAVTVGGDGSGNLTLTDGATLNSYFLNLAQNPDSSGNVTVSGSGTSLNVVSSALMNGSGLASIGLRSNATLTVQQGAEFNAGGNLTAALLAGTFANITVTGSGSRLIVGNQLSLGNATATGGGNVALNITDGGFVQTGSVAYLARGASSSTTLNVSGLGSTFYTANQLQTAAGNAELNILNGGNLTANSTIFLTTSAAGTANVTIDGIGSRFQTNGLFYTYAGTSLINIQNGGTLSAGNTAFLSNLTTASTALNINGSDSLFTTAQMLRTVAGATAINLGNGGSLFADSSVYFSTASTGNTSLVVDGNGSSFTTNQQFQTGAGVSNITIRNGGTLSAGNTTFLSTASTSNTTLTVDGAGSTFSTNSFLQLYNGTVNLNVQNGGTVSALSTIVFGQMAGSNHTINVIGSGSTITTPFNLNIGGSGTQGGLANLFIGDGGTVSAGGNLSLFAPGTVYVNTNGNLNLGGLTNGTATSYGTINTEAGGTIRIAPGSGKLATFNGLITGGGALVKNGAGIQILGGANTYSGGTTINAGMLVVTNASGSGTGYGPVTVNDGGQLAGTGSVLGNVSIFDGGTLTGGYSGTAKLTLLGTTTISGGLLSMGIAGTTAGNAADNYDQIFLGSTGSIFLGDINGNATLLTGLGYVPSFSDQISIIQGTGPNQQVFGSFASLPDGTRFEVGTYASTAYFGVIHYTENSVYISQFSAVPEPAHILLFGSAATGVFGWCRRRAKARASNDNAYPIG